MLQKWKENNFILFFDWEKITENLSFPEANHDEEKILQIYEKFLQKNWENLSKNNIIPELKKFFREEFFENILKNRAKKYKIKQVQKEQGINKWNRILLLLSGIPWAGKSTWIAQNNLEPYTISTDALRLLYGEIKLGNDVAEYISQDYNKIVFKHFYEILERKMKMWQFVVCDATHLRADNFLQYFELAEKYDYEINIKTFDIDLKTALERNKTRGYKQIPTEVLYSFFDLQTQFVIPDGIRKIEKITDLSNNNLDFKIISSNVFYIGDIQGCPRELENFLQKYYNKEDYFVFCGDLLDRWYDNLWVLRIIEPLLDNEKVIFIKWNHDAYLEMYTKNRGKFPVGSEEFDNNTTPQITDFSFEILDKLIAKMCYATYFQVGPKRIFACHGGVTRVQDFISDMQLMKWVGEYREHSETDARFADWAANETGIQYISVHGHRNSGDDSIQVNNRVFNLEWKVEFGGYLRVVKFEQSGRYQLIEIESTLENKYKTTFLQKFLKNPLINVKDLWNDIFSVNFSREAFYKQSWNYLTTRARGLFIGKNDEIYARSYDKFFNIGERSETESHNLAKNLWFPIKIFKKYNGFLGIVGLKDDEVLYLSKSSNSSIFAELVKKHLQKYEEKLLPILKEWYSFIFEICDKTDEHIVEENERPILLDIVKNSYEYEKLDYSYIENFSKNSWLECKKLECIVNNEQELQEFLQNAKSVKHEGFILEWATGFMTKTKSLHYLFWKEIRSDIRRLEKLEKNFKNFSEEDMKKSWVRHIQALRIMQDNNIDFFAHSIPGLIALTKDLKIIDIPKNYHDSE